MSARALTSARTATGLGPESAGLESARYEDVDLRVDQAAVGALRNSDSREVEGWSEQVASVVR